MRFRSILTGCRSLCFVATSMAQIETQSKIKEVMVYATGAMVTRTAKVNVKSGTTEVKIPLLTPLLEQNSVQVGVKSGKATLSSIEYDMEVPSQKQIGKEVSALSKRASVLRDSIDILEGKSSVLDKERSLILKSDNIGGENGFTASTLQGVASYVRKNLNEIISMQYQYQRLRKKYQEELTLNEQKVNLLYSKQMEPMSFLLIKLESPSASNCELEINYFVKNAAWMPFYEARIAKNDTKLHLVQKAYVSQATKERWNDVQLKLSQNDPSVSNEKPELGRYVIPSGSYVGRNVRATDYSNPYVKIMGVVRDKKGPLKGVLVTCADDRKTQTDENGFYELLVPVNESVKFNYSGYSTASCNAKGKNVMVRNVNMDEDNSKVSESEVDQRFLNYIEQKRMISVSQSLMGSDMESNIPQMAIRNTVASIEGKNTVPADGADHEVVVKDLSVDAEYNYYAVPKLSKDVYLVASIPNWKKLDLLDGSVKLFLNNMYMGESFINARQTEDTLNLSIGKDKELAVDRKDMRTYSSKNLIKTSDKVEREWMITVKNNKSEAVKVTVEDQFPVSTNEDIKVELLDNGGAAVDEKEGKLTWKLNLKPGEKRELKFSYSVKSKLPNISVD
ncbi:MAG: mucoidy inhibitor MuiA family protein [Paludibacteraceae bacterium]|nr:mucoidy inhibitor MuiA family protein [Paludibacteraceae bacterium]